MRACQTSLAALLIVSGWLVSCSPSPQPAAPTRPIAAKDAGTKAAARDPSWLQGQVLAQVSEGTFGPYIGYGPKGALALYSPGGAQERRWLAQSLSATGAPSGSPVALGKAPDDAPVALVRPIAGSGGFLALWAHRTDSGSALEGAVLGADGKPAGQILTLAQASGQIVWADTAAAASGTVVLWAEQRRDRASIASVHLESSGRIGQPTPVVPSARAWQIATLPSGSALAIVRPGEKAEAGASIALQLIDGWGRPSGQPLAVSDSPTAELDVDLARLGNTLVFAWTDRRDIDKHVYGAATDLTGKLTTAAHALTPPLGEQSFVSLVAPRGSGDALLVYEDLAQRAPLRRAIRVTTVNAKAEAGGRTVAIDHYLGDRDLPEIAAAPEGFVVLTHAPACTASRPCESAPIPSFVRLDASLGITSGAPLLIDKMPRGVPGTAWGAGCTDKACMALAAGSSSPAMVVSVPLAAAKTKFAPAASLVASHSPPRVVANEVVRSIDEQVSELSAVQVGDRTLLGWVTYFVEPPPGQAPLAAGPKTAGAPGDPKKPAAAQLSVLSLDSSGKAAGAPTILSIRAMSAGGVAIAPGSAANKDACVAWVARDGGDPQVFVTRVTAEGKRDGQQLLTRAKGDASDVAIAWAGDGWVVAWADNRDGNAEVYVAKVDRMLRKVVQDTRLTQAPGDASDVGLFARGQEVFVTWSDPRENKSDGHGDPYLQKLHASTLARIGSEVRLDHSAFHARSVHIGQAGQDLVAGWLAQPVADVPANAVQPGPRMVRIDPKTGSPVGSVAMARTAAGLNPTSFGFACGTEMCQGIVSASPGDMLRADAVLWFPSSPVIQVKTVSSLQGPPGEDISPNVIGDAVFFAEEAGAGETRIRRARLAWTTK